MKHPDRELVEYQGEQYRLLYIESEVIEGKTLVSLTLEKEEVNEPSNN
ncbi:MAG: hypothetical protein GY861_11705 [bacterium]|nr:hypothetical protein [bacterium]